MLGQSVSCFRLTNNELLILAAAPSVESAKMTSFCCSDVVLTSKHHEGWCNFPNSYHWNWNSVDLGPNRDLVGDLTNSVRAAGLHMGLYHSLREWYHPLYLKDNEDNCSTTLFPDEVLRPTLQEMVEKYKVRLLFVA